MFDQILNLVKQNLGNNPNVAAVIPPEQQDAVHKEVATQITKGLATQVPQQGGVSGLLSKLEGGVAAGGPVVSAIEGGLVSSLASKFGLPPMVTGAIAGALPGVLQNFARKANDPNDSSITHDNVTKGLSNLGGMGSLFNR